MQILKQLFSADAYLLRYYMPSYALKGYLAFFKQQKKDLIFSTVNCLSKGSQVRILAQTNIFFLHFHDFICQNTPFWCKNGRFIIKSLIYYYYANMSLFGLNIPIYLVSLPTVPCIEMTNTGSFLSNGSSKLQIFTDIWTFSVRGCWGQPMLLFWELVDETQMSKPPEHTRHHDSRKLLILLPLRAIYFSTF